MFVGDLVSEEGVEDREEARDKFMVFDGVCGDGGDDEELGRQSIRWKFPYRGPRGGRYLGRDGRVVKQPAVVSTASLLGHPLEIIWVGVAAPCR